ncbi:hypothetical protein G5B40_05930 [Pikeienuella piscinae]|uniref:Uncharacterized protein n=1 Tax=Pikeienuella piscinae TaxID=2748098 RepID=A0A7L5BU10_9RHOB|nr:hypothetical protein [Pikeienuella piscinae]QIE55032.1 hypothetical protein G5B40_05930 [Pikeienuella piscinae]
MHVDEARACGVKSAEISQAAKGAIVHCDKAPGEAATSSGIARVAALAGGRVARDRGRASA